MSTILVLCPSHRDRRELPAIAESRGHTLLFQDYASVALEELVAEHPPEGVAIDDPEVEIAKALSQCVKHDVAGVVSTDDYPGSTLAAIVALAAGLPGVAPVVNLLCQHKYHARVAQHRFVPEAVPEFELLTRATTSLRFPVFVKPIKSFFSVGAHPAASPADLAAVLPRCTLPASFFQPIRSLFERHVGLPFGPSCVMAESLLRGRQTTLEGYVDRGELRVLGVVDSIMHPGTLAFERFEYPSSLPDDVQERMGRIAHKVTRGMGFDQGLFNIEFMHDPETGALHIIEINPRMASQFADLFEKVDGTNTYSILLDLATGRTPRTRRRAGPYRMAASCVLRRFADAQVLRVPTAAAVDRLRQRFPDARIEILATEGRMLSQDMQDGRSYRYGLVSIGGDDRRDIGATLAECRRQLQFQFGPPISPISQPSHPGSAAPGSPSRQHASADAGPTVFARHQA